MRKTGIAILITAITALFVVAAQAEQYQDVAILSYYEGEVQLKLNDESNWGPVEPDIALQKNDSIKTGANGKARIVLEDESVIVIGELSLFRISSVEIYNDTGRKNAEFNLEEGLARVKVTKLSTEDSSFTITTPTAVAGVRGTEFAVEALKDRKMTTVTVFEGSVEVGDRINKFKNAVMVMKEQATDVTPGAGAIKPRKVDPAHLKKLRQTLSNAQHESGGNMASANDKKAATVVAIKRSGLDSEKEKELVNDVKSGNVPADQVKTALNLKAQGATDADVDKALDVIRKKDIDPQTVKKLYNDIKNSDNSGSISDEIKKFEDKAKDIDDRPAPPAPGTSPSGAAPKPPAAGQPHKPDINAPDMHDNIKGKVDDAKQNIDDRKTQDGANQATAGNTSGVNSKENMLIERAKKANIPKEKIEQLVRAFKDGKLDFADVSLIIDAAARGVDIRFIENVLGELQKARVNVAIKRLLLNAIRVGMPPAQVKEIFDKIKAAQNTDMSMAEIEQRLKDYIQGRVNPPATNTGTTPPATNPPPTGDTTTPPPTGDTTTPGGDDGTTSGGNTTSAPRTLKR